MADFIFKISPNIILGSYIATRLGQHASDWGDRFMLVVDPILKESGTTAKITQSLDERGVEYFVFDEIPNTASTETLKDALLLARESHVHGVIAVGGGRTLNLAKAVCALYREKGDLYEYIDGKAATTSPLPLICVPTTVRDSFIFTDRTPVSDARSTKIRLLKTQNGLCKLVLWDPNLQINLTEKQSACMSIEVLSFAIEGYLSQKSNFFSDMIIEKSVQLLSYALDGVPSLSITTPQEVLLTQGGCMASLGGASSSFGVANLLANAINSRYQISRSLTTAILLPYIPQVILKLQFSSFTSISIVICYFQYYTF